MMKTRGLRRNRRLVKIVLFAFLLPFYLLFASCDLFSGPKISLLQQINEEVDWENAPKLTVSVAFPQAWGISNPQQGVITPAKDIRKGYAFEIEFAPDIAWSFVEWRAYRSPLPEGWLTDPVLLDGLKRLDGEAAGKLVEVPIIPVRGGTGSFIINTTEAVTLVPWCKSEPYVIRTTPRNSPPTTLYPRGTDIVIYFNAPLAFEADVELRELFESETIKITAGGNKVSADNSCYNYPVYKSSAETGEYTITISASDVPGDKLIEVTVGPDIYNAAGNPMPKAEVFSFNTSPGNAGGGIDTWGASYNGNSITFNWTTNGPVAVEARYRVNKSRDNLLPGNSPRTIYGVNPPDYSGVRAGRNISGIAEYEIFLDLYIEGIKSNTGSLSFKIWNIPGMSVAHNNPLNVINTAEELTAISSGLDKQYVLANDITIDAAWTPLGSASFHCSITDYSNIDPVYIPVDEIPVTEIEIADDSGVFKGKFYGNGHKITINGLNTVSGGDAAFAGLFGVTLGAEIRDLGFACNVSMSGVPASGDFVAGGLVAYAKDTVIRNVVTTGVLAVEVSSGEGTVRIGGITGYFEGKDKIENCRASLSTKYTSIEHIGLAYIGAIAGETGEGDEANTIVTDMGVRIDNYGPSVTLDRLLLNGVSVAADVTADKASNKGHLSIGGAVGRSGQNTMNDITYTAGTVSLYRGICKRIPRYLYIMNCGGLVGSSASNMIECSFSGKICTISEPSKYAGSPGYIYCGGLVGMSTEKGYYNNCRVRADIDLNVFSKLGAGGVFGNGNGNITNCFFEDGNITINILDMPDGMDPDVYNAEYGLGGFAGGLRGAFYNCGTMAGNIKVSSVYSVGLGGFISGSNGKVSNCFSRINMDIDAPRSSIGGFMGSNSNTIEACYATGIIHATSGNIGGMVGQNYGTIRNCYYLGNVVASKNVTASDNEGRVSVGGIAGSQEGTSTAILIENCFSAGRVSASQNATSSCFSTSGGILGYMRMTQVNSSYRNGTIRKTVVLGASVTAKGKPTTDPWSYVDNIVRGAGRIYGFSRDTGGSIPPTDGIYDNYALETMRIEEDEYNSNNPQTRYASSGLTSKDGEDTVASAFYNQRFWTNLGFTIENGWNTKYIARDGYPRLAWEQ
jgi:hypothetical protein